MENEKILKITIEYDTFIKYLKGDEAQKWMDTVEGMSVILHIHHANPFDTYRPDWKYEGNLK
jgi:hypothetical protein